MDSSSKDFFVSYNKADRSWAEWVAWQLEGAGYTVVVQAWDFRPGSNFVLEMHRAAQASQKTIALLSPDYLASSFTQPEWAAAFAQDPTGIQRRLIPVRVKQCDLKGLLPQIIYIDLVDKDEDEAKAVLLAGVADQRGKPSKPPGFPGTVQLGPREVPGFPGVLPNLWLIPHSRNPHFVGRRDMMDDLWRSFTSGDKTSIPLVISGLGGIGKTQMVTEYAYRHSAKYSVVAWLRAETPVVLASDYASLAKELGLQEVHAQDEAIRAVRNWLESHTEWLLIFDNAMGPSELKDYLPRTSSGHVLITSRNPNWRGLAHVIPTKVLTRDESCEFVSRRTGSEEYHAVASLSETLGDLPLALEQASAYIETTGRSVEDYLSLFRTYHHELLRRGITVTGYQGTIATTWEMALEQIQAVPGALELLAMCSFLAPDTISRNDFECVAVSPLQLDDSLAALRSYSLIDLSDGSICVHRLVQAVVRDRLDDSERKKMAGESVKFVERAFAFDRLDRETWPRCAKVLSHALAAGHHAMDLGLSSEELFSLLNTAGQYLRVCGHFMESKVAHEHALIVAENVYGSGHSSTASALNNLAGVLEELGDWRRAKVLYDRAIAINEEQDGSDRTDVAHKWSNLGGLLNKLGDWEQARPLLERALKRNEAAYGPEHPELIYVLTQLASNLEGSGDLSGAMQHAMRALQMAESNFGVDHYITGEVLNNIGVIQAKMGDAKGARTSYERSLAIAEGNLGPSHPTVGNICSNLGHALFELGDLQGANNCYGRALLILENAVGSTHPDVAGVCSNLASVLEGLGDKAGARSHLERALQIDEAAYPVGHYAVVRDLHNLGAFFLASGDPESARDTFRRGISLISEHDSGSREAYKLFEGLGRSLAKLGDMAGARDNLEGALKAGRLAYGPQHPVLAGLLVQLGAAEAHLKNFVRSKVALEEALTILQGKHGPNHRKIAEVLLNLGYTNQELNDLPGAQRCFERVLQVLQDAPQPNPGQEHSALSALLKFAIRNRDLSRTLALLPRAIEVTNQLYGTCHPKSEILIFNLINVQAELGELHLAKQSVETALQEFESRRGREDPFVRLLRGMIPDLIAAIERRKRRR